MTSDGQPTSKKPWTKPELRKLNLTDEQIAELFGLNAELRPRRRARG